jgi:hypothetical protein
MPLRGVVGFATKIDIEINYAIALPKNLAPDRFFVGVKRARQCHAPTWGGRIWDEDGCRDK